MDMLLDMQVTETKNDLVIYHGNCADGFSAAWVFHHMQDKFRWSFDFHPGIYGKYDHPDVADRVVYLVDFSYDIGHMQKICDSADTVVLIDHHKTAIEALDPLSNEGSDLYRSNFLAYTDIERSGAMLAWDFWNNTSDDWKSITPKWTTTAKDDPAYVHPPLLLGHIQDRDLWKFKLPHTREISAQVFSYEYTFENWDKLMSATQFELIQMTVAGAAIERKHFKDIKELLKVTQRPMRIGGVFVPAASLPYTMASDAGQIMAAEYEHGTRFAACYIDTAEHRVFSLRSTPDGVDVSDIAKLYGGEGHKHAAGFKVPRNHPLAQG